MSLFSALCCLCCSVCATLRSRLLEVAKGVVCFLFFSGSRFVEGSAEGSAGAGCSLCLASALVALRKGQDSLGVRLLQLALRRAAVSVQATEAALRFRASRKETLSSCGRRAGLSLGGQIGASSLNAAVAAAGRATSVYAAALERQAFREGGLSRQGDKETAAGGVCVERRSDDDGASSRRRLWNSLLALYALGLVSLHLALLLENRPELHPQIYLQSLPNLAEALKAHNRAAAASCLEGLTGASQGGSEDNVKNKDKAKAAASGGEAGGEAKAARGASSLTPASAAAARYHLRLDGSWAFPAFEASALAALSLRGKTSCRQPPSSVAAGGGSVLSSASCADGKREKRPKHRPLSAAAENSCAASAASGELPSLEAAARAVAASEGSATEDEVLADEIEARQQRGSEGLKRRRRAALLKSDCEKFVDCLLEVAEACARRMSVATASTPSEPCEEETSAASRDEASTKSLPLNPASGTAASVRRRQRRLCSSLSTQTLLVRASVCLHRHCKVGLLPSAAARREVESLLLLLLQRLVRCLCHSGGPPLRSLSRRPHEAELATTRLFACSSLRASGGAAGRLASAGDFAEEDAESGGGFDSHSASAALQLLLYGSAAGVSSNVLPHGVLLALSLILAPNLEGGGAFWRARAAAKAASCRGRSIEPLFSAFGREDKGQGPSAVAAAATSLASTESRVSPRPRRPPPLLGKKGRAFCGRLVLLHRGHAEAEMALGALAAAAFAGRDLWTAPPRLSSFPLPAAGDVAALCAREEIKVSNALGEQLPPLALFGLLSRTNSECRFSAEGDLVWSERSARDCEAEAFPRFEGSACGGCSLPVEDGAFQALLLRLDLHLETLATNAGWEGGSLEKEGHLSSEAVKTLFALSVAKAEVETEAQRMPLLLREAVCECLLRRSERLLFCLGEIQERLQICFYGEQQEVPAALAAECLYLRAMACASASSSLLSTSSSESEETEALSNPRLEFPLSDPRPLRRSSRPLFNSETKRRGPCCCWVEDASVEEPLRKKPHIEGKGEKNSLPEKVRFASQAPALPVGESLSRSLLRPLQGLDSPEEGFCCNQKRAEEAGRLLHEASCFASAALALWKNNAPAVGLWGGHLQKRRRRELRLLVLAETASCIQRLSEQSSDTAAGEEGGRSEASLSEMDSLRRKFASQRRALEEEDGGVASCDGAASEAGASAGLEAFSSRRCACSERRAACCCWGGFRGGSFGCCCVETSASPEVFEDKPFLPCRRRLAGMGRSAATQEASWPLASQPDTTGEERRPGKRQREKAEASSVSLRSAPWICGSDSQQLAAALVATLRSRGEKPF